MSGLSRRHLLGAASGSLLLGLSPLALAASKRNQFVAARVWTANTYTRITLESSEKIKFKHTLSAKRLIVDIEQSNLNNVLSSIPRKVDDSDPYIQNIRVAQQSNGTVRLVFDLKAEINPQIFNLEPVSTYKHRLVIDLYPARRQAAEDDPILSLYNEKTQNIQAQNTPARTQSPIRKASAQTRTNRRPVIMLDPGHGGKDPGAISKNGLREKDVVLSIARETKKRLESLGYKVYMTRNEDIFLPLAVRTKLAQKVQADLFMSIHADSVDRPEPRGMGVYVLSERGASSEAARLLADSQNRVDSIGGVKVSNSKAVNNVLIDMMQNQTMTDSDRLARFVLNQFKSINKIKDEVNHANFVVLRTPDIPSILVETAFLSNPQDEALLRSAAYRKQVAQSIAEGTRLYLSKAILARR